MAGNETFEFAAAIAGVSIGLAVALILSGLAVVGAWRLFQSANEASQAAGRASVSVEDLARRVGAPQFGATGGETQQMAELRHQVETLVSEQRRLEDMTRNILDATSIGGAPALDEIERGIGRLDASVGQMAASLANLIQILERQERR